MNSDAAWVKQKERVDELLGKLHIRQVPSSVAAPVIEKLYFQVWDTMTSATERYTTDTETTVLDNLSLWNDTFQSLLDQIEVHNEKNSAKVLGEKSVISRKCVACATNVVSAVQLWSAEDKAANSFKSLHKHVHAWNNLVKGIPTTSPPVEFLRDGLGRLIERMITAHDGTGKEQVAKMIGQLQKLKDTVAKTALGGKEGKDWRKQGEDLRCADKDAWLKHATGSIQKLKIATGLDTTKMQKAMCHTCN